MTDAATIARQKNAEVLIRDIQDNTIVIRAQFGSGTAMWGLSAGEKATILAALREYADAR